jgi:hypothetical protein
MTLQSKRILMTTFFFVHLLIASAQVSDIRGASSGNASGGSGGSSNGEPSVTNVFLFDFMVSAIEGLAEWQRLTLNKREVNPYLVSLDVISQAAVQPSRYYLINPRIRGNWGLFSTDFRVNYLLEETVNGANDLSSIDWQIIQINMVATKNVVGRIGGGFMKENFGGRKSFFESSVGLFVQSSSKKTGVSIEYRSARDFDTDIVARREFSAHFERKLFSSGYWNTYLTVGGVYQRYYESISVWGVQAGFAFRIFAPSFGPEPLAPSE